MTVQAPTKERARLDGVAGVYHQRAGELNRRLVSTHTMRVLEPYLGPADAVLLMGLGDGHMARGLAELCGEVQVVEGSSELVAGFDPPPRCRIIQGLFEDFVAPMAYDAVIGTHVLEHVDDPVTIIRQTTRWLSADGFALFTVPSRTSLHRRIGRKMGLLRHEGDFSEQDVLLGHRRVYDLAAFQSDLRAGGYSRVEVGGYNLKLVPNVLMADWEPQLLDAVYDLSREMPVDMCADLFAVCRR